MSTAPHERTVLVTGAGGSIGSELCAQIVARAKDTPCTLIAVDNDEYRLYALGQRLGCTGSTTYRALLVDIRHEWVMSKVFEAHRPQVVLHAAALKHVPLLEDPHNMIEAVRTNVLGTRTVLDMTLRYGGERFVMISTDKAVNPTSMMGMTKRAAECYCVGRSLYRTTSVSVVRFGNVTGSSGSVVPLFRRQIDEGGPVTITHPDMTRYMMEIEDAVGLVLDAAGLGSGLYILDMGEPVRIMELAREMIAGRDIPIEIVGIRAGEKLSEELWLPSETPIKTSITRVLQAGNLTESLRDQHLFRALANCADERSVQGMLDLMHRIVPEYRPMGLG